VRHTLIGRAVGNYQVEDVLAVGGSSVVYVAAHRTLPRRVAVKVPRPDVAQTPGALARFLGEARAGCAARHPGLVEILDAGILVDLTPYIVMELLEGETLAAALRRGTPGPALAVEYTVQAAAAVAALHRRGVVHRDLKPENLFLTSRGLKVVDFGVAAVGRAAAGGLTGTPLYMAPEQFTASDVADPRSDIYALGVVLYQMLSGAPPFSSQRLGELAQMHCCCPPPPLHQRQPAVSPPLAAAVHRALAKHPADRFASMESLAAALLVEEPVGQVMSAA
jgi:serine/threonine protein kinase